MAKSLLLKAKRPNHQGVNFYKDGSQWRWRIKASNNRIIGASTESYHNKTDCINNLIEVAQDIISYCNGEPDEPKYKFNPGF